MIEVKAEQAEAVIVSLLGSAEGTEVRAIMRAAVRAGLMWQCVCQQANYPSHQWCGKCGEIRTAGEIQPKKREDA